VLVAAGFGNEKFCHKKGGDVLNGTLQGNQTRKADCCGGYMKEDDFIALMILERKREARGGWQHTL